ncbi:hypothetical protein ALI144C_23220 [Actinosynnema sp. ALI-1.44]|nr:hypothetical protein ALI144C_23220 [Actinosynnema sp. ALI-1.44]
MVLTLVVYSALFIVVGNAVRPLYAEPTTIQRPLVARDSTPVPPESWPVDYGYLDAAGREVDDPVTGRATGNKASSCA